MPAYIVLALAAAASWGASDFLGGVTGRRSPGVSVAFASQLLGLAALLVVAPAVPASVGVGDLAWGVGAGIGGAAGVALLYHGLTVGLMSVVAPITAVGAACLPVVFGLATGERPPLGALLGVVLALGAVALLCGFPALSGSPGAPADPGGSGGSNRGGLLAGAGAGVGFGVFFICLGRAGAGAGLWPLVGARACSVSLLGAVVLTTGRPLLPRAAGAGIVLVGLLDVLANVCYLLAVRRGLLSIVALLASLYPAATLLLARLVLRERLSHAQGVGLAGAGGAVLLIALS